MAEAKKPGGTSQAGSPEAAAASTAGALVDKIQQFVTTLTPSERDLFARMIAPAIARAVAGDDVGGFDAAGWKPSVLPEALVEAFAEAGLRVIGFPDPLA